MNIPYDIVVSHILPKCSIDTRIAFRIKPSKIDMTPFETGSLGDSLKARYNKNVPGQQWVEDETQLHIPFWPSVKSTDNYPDYVHTDLLCKCPVRLNISYAYGLSQSKRGGTDSLGIRVTKTDLRVYWKLPEHAVRIATLTIIPVMPTYRARARNRRGPTPRTVFLSPRAGRPST